MTTQPNGKESAPDVPTLKDGGEPNKNKSPEKDDALAALLETGKEEKALPALAGVPGGDGARGGGWGGQLPAPHRAARTASVH